RLDDPEMPGPRAETCLASAGRAPDAAALGGKGQGGGEAQLRGLDRVLDDLVRCGDYGDPPQLRRWGVQLFEWIFCVLVARVGVGTVVLLMHCFLLTIARALDRRFEDHPRLLLATVMVCCPIILNMTQVLIQDAFLKWKVRKSAEQSALPMHA
ncbi:hypothetical protein H632_c1973p0, partial [Helicosporidium sp. ATCC 50920]